MYVPSWDSVGVHVNMPVLALIEAPVGRLVALYESVSVGMSASVAVMFNASLESSCMVWFDIVFSTGGELASRTVTVNIWESIDMPSDTVALKRYVPICDSEGSQVNTPVCVLIEMPVSRGVRPYVSVFVGTSVSVAVMFSLNID